MRENPDNAPAKKEAYKLSLKEMDEGALREECKKKIWLSAYAANNPISCFHWQCDYCYDETSRRNNVAIYEQAHKSVMRSGGYA